MCSSRLLYVPPSHCLRAFLFTPSSRNTAFITADSQAAAEAALELHGNELGPNLSLNVYISNPERKKERTDADANAREVYVSGLSKFAEKSDLERVFKTVSLRCLCPCRVQLRRFTDDFVICGVLAVCGWYSTDLSRRSG